MASEILTHLTTYDDYRHLPDDGKQYQIIGGKLFMTPAPTTEHQRLVREIFIPVYNYAKEKNMGEVLFSPTDVVLSMTDVIQPDILFVAKERRHIISKKNIVEAPDLVVEVLSEHTQVIDRDKKNNCTEPRCERVLDCIPGCSNCGDLCPGGSRKNRIKSLSPLFFRRCSFQSSLFRPGTAPE